MRKYKCLNKNEFHYNFYSLVPIRDQDKYDILNWRNSQIEILRQKEPLSIIEQEGYFKNVVNELFEKEKPDQILWSFFEREDLIGYGGLVHIDWDAKNAEISFVLCNERNININLFKKDWSHYLTMITEIAKEHLFFTKIYTYAYDIRDYYFEVMYQQNFILEARLKSHISIKNKLYDVLILSKHLVSNENSNLNRQ